MEPPHLENNPSQTHTKSQNANEDTIPNISKTANSNSKPKPAHNRQQQTFKMILFETSSSVFELLWDIALALFILRISFVYCSLIFLSSLFISYFNHLSLSPLSLTSPPSPLYLFFYILLITLWARWTIVIYEVPRVAGFRVAVGLVAASYTIFAEMVLGVVGYEIGGFGRVVEWGFEKSLWEGVEGGGVLVLMVLMPVLLMVVERETDELGEVRTRHGHEKKGVLDAVPTVAMSGKEKIGNGKNTD